MDKITLLRANNMLLLISMVIQVVTGAALFLNLFVMNAPVFHAIIETHEYNGLIFAIFVLSHLVLNWGWMKNQFFSSKKAA